MAVSTRRLDAPTPSPLRSRLVLWIAAALLLAACSDTTGDSSDYPSMEPDAPPKSAVQVARGSSKPASRDPQIATGSKITTAEEDRRAIVAVLKGDYDAGDSEPYSAQLVRTIDGNVYRDIDHDSDGPDHWITRAKIVDADGEVLWKDHVNSFFQLLEYLKLVLDETSSIDFTLFQVFSFAEGDYPSLLEFPVQVPIGLDGAAEYILEAPDDSGSYYEVFRHDIEDLVSRAEPPNLDGEVRTLSKTGPPSDRIDVAILGDGYTVDQQQKFLGDARAVAERILETEPFANHTNLFNFKAVWTPSEESGAGYDCRGPNDRNCKRDFRDTYYRYVFVVSALIEQFGLDLPPASSRVAMPLEIGRMADASAAAGADEVLLISNSDRRSGFAGMYAGVLTAFDDRDDFPDVAVHEFGHSFGVLGDEYFLRSDACLYNAPRMPLPANIAEHASREKLKWSQWVPQNTPLPTPAALASQHPIGAFRRAYNCPFLFRPKFDCKMRDSSKPFGPVCKEQLARRLYNDVDLLRPGYPMIRRGANGQLTFEIGARQSGEIVETRWELAGEPLAKGSTLALPGHRVPSSWTKLTATVDGRGSAVRKDAPRLEETFTWWVRSR